MSVISWVSAVEGCPLSGVPLYSHRAVIGWRHPDLVPAWLRAKKEDHPRLICRKVLLSVEGEVDLRIPMQVLLHNI